MDETIDDAATDNQDWGAVITSSVSTIGGLASLWAPNRQVQQPVTTAGPIAANPAAQPSFASKLGLPLWALISGGVVILLLVVVLIKKLF
jgi:hypothetical protein